MSTMVQPIGKETQEIVRTALGVNRGPDSFDENTPISPTIVANHFKAPVPVDQTPIFDRGGESQAYGGTAIENKTTVFSGTGSKYATSEVATNFVWDIEAIACRQQGTATVTYLYLYLEDKAGQQMPLAVEGSPSSSIATTLHWVPGRPFYLPAGWSVFVKAEVTADTNGQVDLYIKHRFWNFGNSVV